MFILLLILALIIFYYFYYKKEHFDSFYGGFCGNCEKKTFGQCMQCANCGFGIINKNIGLCTKGDMLGSYENINFKKWYYNDPYWRQNKEIMPAFTQ